MGGGFRGGGGGFRGGGFVGGGGFRGGFVGGGFRGGGFKGGFGGNRFGFRGFNRGFGRFGNRNFFVGGFWPWWGWGGGWGGWGGGYWPAYSDWGYDPYDYPAAYPAYNYDYSNAYPVSSYPAYAPSQSAPNNVTIVIPQASAQRANPIIREYDQYGQEILRSGDTSMAPPGGSMAPSAGPPVYLIAFKDRVIRAVSAYWVSGNTLHYVTLDHQEQTVALDQLDRALSEQLNRERRVQFSLSAR